MPQLDPSSYISQVFWLFISFSLLYLFVKYWFLPRIQSSFVARETKINKLIAEAENLKNQTTLVREKHLAELKNLNMELDKINSDTERFCNKHYESSMLLLQNNFSTQKEELTDILNKWQEDFNDKIDSITIDLSKTLANRVLKQNNSQELVDKINFAKYFDKIKDE
jgi:F-type H+-transporting ATPase subunit b